MGLAGRKQKQRIPADPRNLSWADDASRFGLSYLSKFGWDTTQGLGSSGDGMKTHLKVQQKLDMMGIGAQHQRDPNGIAWKQNKDFEALLKRLNASDAQPENTEDGHDTTMGEAENQLKKRKVDVDPEFSQNTNKKRKKETSNPHDSPASASQPMHKSRPMAHRARMRAAKRIAGKSAPAIAEILGIAPSSTSTSTPTTVPASPSSTPAPQPDNMTTSTKSVADYFKEKMIARSSSSTPSGSATPGLGAARPGHQVSFPDDEGLSQRRGIGTPSHVPEAESPCDIFPDKQQRKIDKWKRSEEKASQATLEDVVEEQVAEVEARRVQETSKKVKKRREEKDQESNDSSVHDPNKKSKRERKKKRTM